MRVEHVGMPKSITESPQRQGLTQGDILVAEVTELKGDQVFLKNQEGGAVLTAKLMSDIAVSVGDYVETVVDDTSGGRIVLRVLDISRQMPFGSEADDLKTLTTQNHSARAQALHNTLVMLKNNPGADPKAAAFLSKHGITGSAENIETVSQMAKGMTAVTTLLTELIHSFDIGKEQAGSLAPTAQTMQPAANTISMTQTAQPVMSTDSLAQAVVSTDAQTPRAMSSQTADLVQTPDGAAKVSAALANEVMQTDTVRVTLTGSQTPAETQTILQPATQETTAAGQSVGQTAPAENALTNAAAPHAEPAQAITQPAAQIQNTDGQAAPANQANPQAVSQSANAGALSANAAENPHAVLHTSAPETTLDTDLTARTNAPLNEAQSIKMPAAGTADKAAQILEQQKIAATPKEMPEQITSKALAMFVNLEDADELAVHLKKAVQELPEQIKELKVLIEHTDNTVKETVAAKFDQIEKQMSMMNEVRRFDCYQIPLQSGPQQQTAAELYVYRYRSGKKTVDPENILILLGLDTQYMGRVETLIKTNGKSLSVEFNIEDMRLSDEMKADSARLEQTINETGYHLAGVSVKPLTARTMVLNAENRLEKETGGSAGNVDVRI